MNALINLKDCKEFMTITLNNKDHHIKLAGTIEDPYFCGHDVGIVLGYVDVKKILQKFVDNDEKKSLKELNDEMGHSTSPNSILGKYHKILSYHDGRAVYVSESGLYSLLSSCKLPNSKPFKAFMDPTICDTNLESWTFLPSLAPPAPAMQSIARTKKLQ